MLYCGIDIGTQSIKTMVIDENGIVQAESGMKLKKSNFFTNDENFQCHEQDPQNWWECTTICIKNIVKQLQKSNLDLTNIAGISISGTSGTVLFLDSDMNPLMDAMMYNDSRAVNAAKLINTQSLEHCNNHGYQFSSSFALSKILWVSRNNPKLWDRTAMINHCSDYIAGKITGEFRISDYSNALKTGYDLIKLQWPAFIEDSLGLSLGKFPKIIAPGDFIANTSMEFEKITGFPRDIPVFGGLTDSTASLLSAGAISCGDIFSVLGSTIVAKVISSEIIKDPHGRIYSHRLPNDNWIPGGAGNVGALTLVEKFGAENLPELDKSIQNFYQSNNIVYPLSHQGERFPFKDPNARGFEIGKFRSTAEKYAAYIEGLCFTEQMMLDVFEDLNIKLGNQIYSIGGATKSSPWMQLRATILNKEIKVPMVPEASYGSALLVGCMTDYCKDLEKACTMISIKESYQPQTEKFNIYQKKYLKFRSIIKEKIEKRWR
jgi:D-ribulokinase